MEITDVEISRKELNSHRNARKKQKKERFALRRKPSNRSEWVALADELLNWVRTSNSPYIHEFAVQKGYGSYRLRKWRTEDNYFGEVYEYVCTTLALRREILASDRSRDNKLLNRLQPLYDWSLAEYEQEAQKEIVDKLKKMVYTVGITDPTIVPDTGLVPSPKRDDDENDQESKSS